MNTHLESTRQGSFARKKQLKECFDLIRQTNEDHSVIFGGDLNLHDTEVRVFFAPSGSQSIK
jgi:hypothetical protein